MAKLARDPRFHLVRGPGKGFIGPVSSPTLGPSWRRWLGLTG